MPDWMKHPIRTIQNRRKEARWKEIIEDNERPWNLDYLRSNILDAEEKLHLQSIWRHVGLAWASVGNLALLAASVTVSLTRNEIANRYILYIYILTAVSVVASPLLAYLQYKKSRAIRLIVKKLNIVYRRHMRTLGEAESSGEDADSVLAHQKRYRDETQDVISQLRGDADRYRKRNNRFQSTVIIGSVLTSALTTASVSFSSTRWVTVVVSGLVGMAAGFMGYFKFRERSFNLQQTADAIEREYESVELRVGKYFNKNQEEAYAIFAETVELLRDEQNKREQQLDQPSDAKREEIVRS